MCNSKMNRYVFHGTSRFCRPTAIYKSHCNFSAQYPCVFDPIRDNKTQQPTYWRQYNLGWLVEVFLTTQKHADTIIVSSEAYSYRFVVLRNSTTIIYLLYDCVWFRIIKNNPYTY